VPQQAGFLEGEIWGLPKVAVYGGAAVLGVVLLSKYAKKQQKGRSKRKSKK
jgi:hypothetical protein